MPQISRGISRWFPLNPTVFLAAFKNGLRAIIVNLIHRKQRRPLPFEGHGKLLMWNCLHLVKLSNRNYEDFLPRRTAKSNAFRIQSDLLSDDVAIAACISSFSSGESLALTIIPRNLAFATFGLPIFCFINSLCKTKINVDKAYISSYDKSTLKTIWQTN
jgi:hypothetical protein